MPSPHPALTYDRQLLILRHVILGVPPRRDETPPEKHWRELCEEPGPHSPEKSWADAMLKALDHIDELEKKLAALRESLHAL